MNRRHIQACATRESDVAARGHLQRGGDKSDIGSFVRDVSPGASATSQISVTWELDKSICPEVNLCGGRLRIL